jgi:hypothetical protein
MNICLEDGMSTATNNDRRLIEELRSSIAAMVDDRSRQATVGDAWLTNTDRLCQKILISDPNDFLNWDMISRTMVVGNADFVRDELDFLKNLPDWKERWENALQESPVGHPTYLAQFEKLTGIDIGQASFIFEFGGGYGSLCRLVHRLNFKGRYVIYDLPPFSALQLFFLKMNCISSMTSSAYAGKASNEVICVSEFKHLESILADDVNMDDAVFIATWSLSETPVSLRQTILSLVKQFRAFLVAYQGCFGNIDNMGFFDEWMNTMMNIEWHRWKIEHLPNQLYRDNYYLMGKKR